MSTWALDEYRALRRVALRHARDAFRDPGFLARWWRELGYRAEPDYARAVDEYDGFAAALASCGATIEYLPTVEGMTPDAIYVRDATIVTPRGLWPCTMGKPARASEPALAQAHLQALGLTVVPGDAAGDVAGDLAGDVAGDLADDLVDDLAGDAPDTGVLEGGDVVWFDSQTVVVGEGYRTDPLGIARMRALLPDSVDLVVCPLPHHRGPAGVFHLMSILSPLDVDLALVFSPLMPVRMRRWLLDRGMVLVEVPDSEFDAMGCNVLALGPSRCLMLEGLPETRARLERAGCEVLTYAGEEISRKGDGGPTCLTRPLERGPDSDASAS